jgi:two-component system OmpR family sensor kinase
VSPTLRARIPRARTLRQRIFSTLVFAVLASTVLTVVVSEALVRRRAENQARSQLVMVANAIAVQPTLLTASHPRRRRRLALTGTDGSLSRVFAYRPARTPPVTELSLARSSAVLAQLPGRPDGTGQGTIIVGGRKLLFAARSSPLGRFVLVRPAALGAGDQAPFAASIVLAGGAAALLAALLAWLLARRLTRPLGELAAASRELGEREEAAEIPLRSDTPREIAALVATFNTMSRELSAARGAQRSFLLSVSHELKTPLTAIAGWAEGLEDDAVAPREAGGVIAAEARRLDRLIRDLLDLARLDRHEFRIERTPLMLGSVAEEVRSRYARRAQEAEVSLRISGQASASVLGDHDRVVQIVSNLVENALGVTPVGGAIVLELAPGRLTVADTGPGVAAEDLPRAFERFYLHRRRADGGRDGSGLGLAIVAELTAAMGGRARVTSAPGQGAQFTIELPVAGGVSATTGQARAAIERARP